ncbi:MAG: RNA polymerase sigma factor [Deltaproteobacteria bacterium]
MSAENYTIQDDDNLIKRSQQGDLKAFEWLVREYEKKMLNIAFRLMGNYEEACDVVQEAFVLAYRNIKGFRGVSKFSTWLSAIVVNSSKKRLVQIKTKRYYESISVDEPTPSGRAREYGDEKPSAAEIIEKREVMERIEGCLRRLDAEFREVVVLRDVEGERYEEISEMLKLPEGTVKSRLFRARAILKNCLKRYVVGGII